MTEKDIKRIQELKEELKKIADEGNISKEDKEMMHVFVAGMPVNGFSCDAFVNRGGRIPAPIHSFKN